LSGCLVILISVSFARSLSSVNTATFTHTDHGLTALRLRMQCASPWNGWESRVLAHYKIIRRDFFILILSTGRCWSTHWTAEREPPRPVLNLLFRRYRVITLFGCHFKRAMTSLVEIRWQSGSEPPLRYTPNIRCSCLVGLLKSQLTLGRVAFF